MNIKNKVQAFYDQLYRQPEFKQESLVKLWTRERELENILKLIKREDVVLDIGCGDGGPTLLIARKAKSAIGFDISKEAIRLAKQKLRNNKIKNCSFFQGDIENLKYPENSVDFILCLGIFEYFLSIDKSLKCIYRILKPGGKLYFHVWNKESLSVRFKKIFRLLDKKKPFKRHFFTYSEIESTLVKNGFVLKNYYGQLIAIQFFSIFDKLNIELKSKNVFICLENLGRIKFFARFFSESLAFISEKPQIFR